MKKSYYFARTISGPLAGLRWNWALVETAPFALAFAELQRSYEGGDSEQFNSRQFPLLGQLIAGGRRSTRDFTSNLLSYIGGSGSMRGLESLFLTATHMSWLAADQRMYQAALSLWKDTRFVGQPKRSVPRIYFFDRQHNLGTVITATFFDRIRQELLKGVLGGGDVGSLIRGFGPGSASDVENDFTQCISGWSETFGVIGAVVGGALVGIAVAVTGGMAAVAAGDAMAVFTGLGAVIGTGIGIVKCAPQTSPPPSKDTGTPVSSNTESSESEPKSSGQTNTGAVVMAGGTDESTQSTGDPPPQDGQPSDEGKTKTALVYPVPDDLRGLVANLVELVSTPTPEGDDNAPKLPKGIRGPNPGLLPASATFALHAINALAGNLQRMPIAIE